MGTLAGFQFFPVDFGKQGQVLDETQVQALLTHVTGLGKANLLVMSHGWNNDKAEAEALYAELLGNLGKQYEGDLPVVVLGVFWPSKKFANRDLIPGGAAGLVGDDPLLEHIEQLRGFFDVDDESRLLGELKALVPVLLDDESKRQFVAKVLRLIGGTADLEEEGGARALDATAVLDALVPPAATLGDVEAGGAAATGETGGAAGLGDFLSGARGLAQNALNMVTYYQMKERAGTVGSGGVLDVLARAKQANSALKVHLVGHSFGGRVVTSACLGRAGGPAVRVESLTLLQAAFSHNGFAKNFYEGKNGAFLDVVRQEKVKGPIVITHTRNDKAVGIMYAIASRVGGQDAAKLGDAADRFGGIGANGAQKSEAVQLQLLAIDKSYTLQNGRIHNLLADTYIADHGDVRGPQVAHALLAAIEAGNA